MKYILATQTTHTTDYRATKNIKTATSISLFWLCKVEDTDNKQMECAFLTAKINGTAKYYTKAETRLLKKIDPLNEFEYTTEVFELSDFDETTFDLDSSDFYSAVEVAQGVIEAIHNKIKRNLQRSKERQILQNRYRDLETRTLNLLREKIEDSNFISTHTQTKTVRTHHNDMREITTVDDKLIFLDKNGYMFDLLSFIDLEDLINLL